MHACLLPARLLAGLLDMHSGTSEVKILFMHMHNCGLPHTIVTYNPPPNAFALIGYETNSICCQSTRCQLACVLMLNTVIIDTTIMCIVLSATEYSELSFQTSNPTA